VVYPHKTGGYVQPVDKSTKENLDRLDRRAPARGRVTKSGSSSWDRWLKQYQETKKEKKRVVQRTDRIPGQIVRTTRSNVSIKTEAVDIYVRDGYDKALSYLNQLFQADEITLLQKSNVSNYLTDLQIMNRKQRKFILEVAREKTEQRIQDSNWRNT
tara:strand:+ start:4368 stop:4838 length:471 start_codon:yes stop_codon:yes gene_type:complete